MCETAVEADLALTFTRALSHSARNTRILCYDRIS